MIVKYLKKYNLILFLFISTCFIFKIISVKYNKITWISCKSHTIQHVIINFLFKWSSFLSICNKLL